MAVSEIARIRESIANEYLAAKWGLSGLAYGMPKHRFISIRMERIEEGHQTLAARMGDEQAMILVAETLASLPDHPERASVLAVIKHMQGDTKQTVYLLEVIRNVWEKVDLLIERLGMEDAQKILTAPAQSADLSEEKGAS